MKIILLKILMMISTTIIFLKTPMSMGTLLLIQTTLSAMLLSKIMLTSWVSMIMFLMFIGGLLILFMYMSSIASNEKFKLNFKLLTIMLLFFMIPMEEMLIESQMNDLMENFTKTEYLSLNKIYNKKTLMITVLMFMYMFLTMISVTSIINIFKGPLRAKKT
uniref:NADH dehydrogenase subunit 6 n=1 Tax=Doratura homophyla TaxID=1671211 RepID=UPI0021D531D4|nr:NADH dehydrogenase subunit 6 [Doratura homophyla]UXD78636.1 NADH dehydrogenase subunit 6 [Doratura homophyla]